MFEVRRYSPEQAEAWNEFVRHSKNGTFLFDRCYMDYHSDRFCDQSLMVYRKGRLYALLPANRGNEGVLESHGGLTYGGLVMSRHCTGAEVTEVMRLICDYWRTEGYTKVLYKPVPWIYHQQPSEEDLYALFAVCDARIVARGLSATVCRDDRNAMYRIREMGRRRAEAEGVVIEESDCLAPFWEILTHNLQTRYQLNPVHSLSEIELLRCRFPKNIRLFEARRADEVLAGTVLYVTDRVVHSQYIAASAEGRRLHALDLLFAKVVDKSLETHPFFDFGISTERDGDYLNEQLAYQKEGFGARAICYDHYEWLLT